MEASWSLVVATDGNRSQVAQPFSYSLLQLFHDRVRAAAARTLVVAVSHERHGRARFPECGLSLRGLETLVAWVLSPRFVPIALVVLPDPSRPQGTSKLDTHGCACPTRTRRPSRAGAYARSRGASWRFRTRSSRMTAPVRSTSVHSPPRTLSPRARSCFSEADTRSWSASSKNASTRVRRVTG